MTHLDADDAVDVFPFVLKEKSLIDRLNASVRARMVTAAPSTLMQLATFLYALERLPYPTPNMGRHLYITPPHGAAYSYVGVLLSNYELSLSVRRFSLSADPDSEEGEEILFSLHIDGWREGSTATFIEWLDAFNAASGTLRIEGYEDVDMTLRGRDDGWQRVANHWGDQDCLHD